MSQSSSASIVTLPVPFAKDIDNPIDLRKRHWFLTWNNPPEGGKEILLSLRSYRFAFQMEIGTSGTPHWQGVFSFKEAVKWSVLCSKCEGAYWAVCRNIHAAKNYCTKLDSSTGEIYSNGYRIEIRVRDPLEGKVLYPWQSDIVMMLAGEPDDRSIYWFWSAVGNIGKSALCKHLCLKHNAFVLGGAFKDGLFAISKMVEKGMPPKVLIWDIPRVQANHMSYACLEKVKDGCFFSAKYESVQCLFNPPHVLVFANEPPELGNMSSDRWKVTCLDTSPPGTPSTPPTPPYNFNKYTNGSGYWDKVEADANNE